MDDRSNTESDVEIVNEAPAEDVAELDDVELGEMDNTAEEIAELDDAELVAENDIEFDDAVLEDEAAAEEIAELDEIDTLDSQPEPIDEPVLQLETADTHAFEHGLRRDLPDPSGDGGKAPVLRRDPPADPVLDTPEFLPPPPEAQFVMPALVNDDTGSSSTNSSKNPEAINSEPQDMEKSSEGKYF